MQLKLSQYLFKYEGVYFGNLMLVSIVNLSPIMDADTS
jgi:hypothetical protein